jgi:Ca-activated chloride channel family protein
MIRRLLASLALVSVPASLLVALQPTFSARVEGVRIDVLVTQNGKPVRGLTAADFELLDNGVPQRIEAVGTGQAPICLVLAFDLSESVKGRRLEDLRQASDMLIARLAPEDQAALVTFNHAVTLRSALTSDHSRVRLALARAEAAGQTALVDGTFAAIGVGESDAGRSLLVVFSDGIDTSSWLPPAAVLGSARRADIVIYAVSSGTATRRLLGELTELTGGQLLTEPRSDRLAATFGAILDEFRQRYVLTYSPQGVDRDGWHRLEVRVKGRPLKVQARPGYLAGS